MKEFNWQTACEYTIIDNNAILKNLGISDKDIKEHGNEMCEQIVCLFNYMSFSNA